MKEWYFPEAEKKNKHVGCDLINHAMIIRAILLRKHVNDVYHLAVNTEIEDFNEM